MSNLVFSLNATMPLFLLMLLGILLRRIGWCDAAFASKLNSFVFKVTLPVLMFKDLAVMDIREAWNGKFVLFCFVVTLLSILLATGIAALWKDRSIRGEYIQASYRSSAAMLGLAFIQNIYGTSGMGPMMILGSVPLYNIMAVTVLSVTSPQNGGKLDRTALRKTLVGIAKNPIILGIAAGFLWSILRIPSPAFFTKAMNSLGNCTSPLGLVAMGASVEFGKLYDKLRPAAVAATTKLVVFCLLFLPVAILLGFRNEELIAILVMLGSPTTVSCYIMATNMGHEGSLTSGAVMLTTLFSAFTLTFWLFLLKTLGYV